MNLHLTETEKWGFLIKRGYKMAEYPCHYTTQLGPDEDIHDTKVVVAVRGEVDWQLLKTKYWAGEVETGWSVDAVFEKELKRALLKL